MLRAQKQKRLMSNISDIANRMVVWNNTEAIAWRSMCAHSWFVHLLLLRCFILLFAIFCFFLCRNIAFAEICFLCIIRTFYVHSGFILFCRTNYKLSHISICIHRNCDILFLSHSINIMFCLKLSITKHCFGTNKNWIKSATNQDNFMQIAHNIPKQQPKQWTQ